MSTIVNISFNGMNNVVDPAHIPFDVRRAAMTEAADLVNVDVDDSGSISVRNRRTATLATIDSVSFEGLTYTAGSQALSIGSTVSFDDTATATYAEGHFDTYFSGGDCIDYYNGCIFRGGTLDGIATVLQSKPFEHDTIDSRNHVAYLSGSEITMIGAVNDGVYIGTQNELVFLSGDGSIDNGFTVVEIFPYGVIKGTRVRSVGHKTPIAKMDNTVIVFATYRGVVVAGNGGNAVNLSYGKVTYPHGTSGSAILREENGQVHYVFMPGSGSSAENIYTAPTIDVDQL